MKRKQAKMRKGPFWLSFAAEISLGVVIVEANDPKEALDLVNKLGINPGGEVMMLDMRVSPSLLKEAEGLPHNQLIPTQRLKARNYKQAYQVSEQAKQEIAKSGWIVCEACNEGHCHEHQQ